MQYVLSIWTIIVIVCNNPIFGMYYGILLIFLLYNNNNRLTSQIGIEQKRKKAWIHLIIKLKL